MGDELMTIQDIADLYHCAYTTARDCKVKVIGFPQRVRGSSSRRPLWLRKEIAEFLSSKEPETI